MQNKKYSLASAVGFCFRYTPGATIAKLIFEIVNGVLVPLMVLVVAWFINSAVAFVSNSGKITHLIVAPVLMTAYYAPKLIQS